MPLATYLRGWSTLLYVWLAWGGTQMQPHRTFWGRSLAHCLYGQTVHPWLKRPTRYHMLHLELWPCDRRCIEWFPSVSAILSADSANPTVEPNMKWIRRPLVDIWSFEISPIWAKLEVGRSVGGSVGPQYFFLHWSHILLFATLGTYRARSEKLTKCPNFT